MRNLTVFACLFFLIGLNACKTYKLVEFTPSDPNIKIYYSPLDPDDVGNYRWDGHTVAEVIENPEGELIIVVDTFYIQNLPPLLQEFVLRHEEGHIILGVDLNWKFTTAEKLDAQATCYAMIFFNDIEIKLIKIMAKEHHLKEGLVNCWE
ncbi:MAG: hypothetical protein L3J07_03615 [Candidatus Magasanikbacteria bacterium]|nr:hypothetical protein [Candidatus Magasanikbacteria bacterium]